MPLYLAQTVEVPRSPTSSRTKWVPAGSVGQSGYSTHRLHLPGYQLVWYPSANAAAGLYLIADAPGELVSTARRRTLAQALGRQEAELESDKVDDLLLALQHAGLSPGALLKRKVTANDVLLGSPFEQHFARRIAGGDYMVDSSGVTRRLGDTPPIVPSTTQITDNFNRANTSADDWTGDASGLTWSFPYNANSTAWAILSNQGYGIRQTSNPGTARTGTVDSDDHTTQGTIVLKTRNANIWETGMVARLGTGENGFVMDAYHDASTQEYAVYDMNGGSWQQYGSSYSVTPAVNDVVAVEIIGDGASGTVKGYLNGTERISGTGATAYTTVVYGGVFTFQDGTNNAFAWDTFSITDDGYGSSVTGTAAATLPGLTAAATGVMQPSGTAVATLPSLTTSAAGVMQPSGTAVATLPSLVTTASGSVTAGGGVTGTAVTTLPSVTAAAAGGQTQSGTSVATLPSLTATAAGAQTQSGTSATTLPALTASAAGVMQPSGTASAALPALTASAAGLHTVPVTGTAAATLPALTTSATGAASGATSSSTTRRARRVRTRGARPRIELTALVQEYDVTVPAPVMLAPANIWTAALLELAAQADTYTLRGAASATPSLWAASSGVRALPLPTTHGGAAQQRDGMHDEIRRLLAYVEAQDDLMLASARRLRELEELDELRQLGVL